MVIDGLLEFMVLVSAILTILLILVQQRGASLGSGMSSSSELYTTRRGLEKSLFVATIVTSTVMVVGILGMLIIPA